MCNRTLAAFISGVILPELLWQLLYLVLRDDRLPCELGCFVWYKPTNIISTSVYHVVVMHVSLNSLEAFLRDAMLSYVVSSLVLHEAVNSSTYVRHSFQQQFMVMRVSAHSSKPFLRDTLSSTIISNFCFYMWL